MPLRQGALDAPRNSDLTEVRLTFIATKIEQVCLFGHAIDEKTIDAEHRALLFTPGSVFALARWTATSFGATHSRLEILRAVAPGQPHIVLPFIRPGAEALLRVGGSDKVQTALQIIEHIAEDGIDPADAAPDYWLHVGNRLAGGQPPRRYTRARHAIWKLRRRVAP